MQRLFTVLIPMLMIFAAQASAENMLDATQVQSTYNCDSDSEKCFCTGDECTKLANDGNCAIDANNTVKLYCSPNEKSGQCACQMNPAKFKPINILKVRGEFPIADKLAAKDNSATRENEIVPSRRGNDGNESEPNTNHNAPNSKPSRLASPTHVTITGGTATTLNLSWRDNSTEEYGVAVYRVPAEEVARSPKVNWKFVGKFNEVIHSNIVGTGMRTDEDIELTSKTEYCYRLQAYIGHDRKERSAPSEMVCASTF